MTSREKDPSCFGMQGKKENPEWSVSTCGSACPCLSLTCDSGPTLIILPRFCTSQARALNQMIPNVPASVNDSVSFVCCLLFPHEITVSPSPLRSRFPERSSKPSPPGKGEQ